MVFILFRKYKGGGYVKVTIDKEHSDLMGLDVTDVSVVFDNKRNVLMIYGMLLPTPSYQFAKNDMEPNIVCSFHDDQGRILFINKAQDYMSFRLNKYSLFSSEITAATEHFNFQSVSEIRLLPFFSEHHRGMNQNTLVAES